jgi:hypothetical protein
MDLHLSPPSFATLETEKTCVSPIRRQEIQMADETYCRDTLVVRMCGLVLLPEVLPAISLYSSVMYPQRQDCSIWR